jgi:hypothetical protein
MIVYGSVVRPIKRTLSIPLGALATVLVTLAMIALSALWIRWKGEREGKKAGLKQPRPSPTMQPARTGL